MPQLLPVEVPAGLAPDGSAELETEARGTRRATTLPGLVRTLETQRLGEVQSSTVDLRPRGEAEVGDVLEDEAALVKLELRLRIPGEGDGRVGRRVTGEKVHGHD